MKPYYQREGVTVWNQRCEDVLADMADSSVDLIASDPPYFRVKTDEPWDNQWDTAEGFLTWLGGICQQWRRVLKPNGSLYVFASPDMAARVEVLIGQRFAVLNRIVWRKQDGTYNEGGLWSRASKEAMRSFFPQTEYIIFAEQYGCEGADTCGYGYSSGLLHSRVMRPIKQYLNGERERAGLSVADIDRLTGTAMAGHWFTHPSQWTLPTQAWYERLQEVLNNAGKKNGSPHLARGWESLREEYENLRQRYEQERADYESLRRPFNVTKAVPFTDVWDFATVAAYPGKHPAEKPVAIWEHIIRTSTRPGALVLDTFIGTGSCGKACIGLGRQFVGVDANAKYCEQSLGRLAQPGLFDWQEEETEGEEDG